MEQNQNNKLSKNQHHKQGYQNTRVRQENSRSTEKNKQFLRGRNSNANDNSIEKIQQGNKDKSLNQDRAKNRDRYAAKSREKKVAVKSNQTKTGKSDSGSASGYNTRYGRNTSKNLIHSEILGKNISPKRVETLEDIQADIERIDKDIQFEIKQIKAVKLGL
ncbi:MAG: hypothetical protein ACOYIF_04050 [Acetivibrionales bacterium]|jgi:hypothetical protein